MLPRHFVEILEMNDGDYYLLQINEHEVDGWNCGAEHPHEWGFDHSKRVLYRFNTKLLARGAFIDFQIAAI